MAAGKSFIKPDINLIPGDFLLARWKKRQKYYLLLVLFAVPLFCLLVYLYPEMLIRRYEREMLEIEDALQQVQDDRLLYEFFLDQKEEYEEILKVYEEISGRGFSAVEQDLRILQQMLQWIIFTSQVKESVLRTADLGCRAAGDLEGADAKMEKIRNWRPGRDKPDASSS